MLTAQANHLREMAYTVERVKNDAIGKLSLSGSITLATAAMDMRDAADTIAQLRNTCNDLQRENEKLRELVAHLMYVKPAEVTAIAYNGKLLRFDEMLAEVGMRFEVER
jgi:hypothetical protein